MIIYRLNSNRQSSPLPLALHILSRLILGVCLILALTGCRDHSVSAPVPPAPAVTFKPQEMADALHAVIAADREAYARYVLEQLPPQTETIPVPAHLMRLASDSIQQKGAEFHYVLRSLSPINPKNAPETATEKTGLQAVLEHPDQNFYAEESLGGRRYFTAVYADKAVVQRCADCHNQLPNSPKRDYKVGDVMGGVVVRVPLEF